MDASHLVMTVNAAAREDINDIAVVHDQFGTYAADTHRFREIINRQFFELYCPDVLAGFVKQLNTQLPALPEYGTYDIAEVLDAKYFFG